MKLKKFVIPETRLFPDCIQDIKTIYDSLGDSETTTADLANILGYRSYTTQGFYKRFDSLTIYGLIERRAKIRVSDLGKRLAYPENENDRKLAIKEAVLNVPVWAQFFSKFKKNIPQENFWVQIRNVTGAESPTAQKVESDIAKWYTNDVSQITEDLLPSQIETKRLSSGNNISNSMMSEVNTEDIGNAMGTLVANGIGRVEISDKDTLTLARTFLNILEKKLEKSIDNETSGESIESEKEKSANS